MVDSVSGSAQTQALNGPSGDLDIAEKVKLGYELKNSSSTVTGEKAGFEATNLKLSPTIPPSDANTPAPTDTQLQQQQTQASSIRAQGYLSNGLDQLAENNLDAVSPELLDRLEVVHDQLYALESLSPEATNSLTINAKMFAVHAYSPHGEISPDKLDFLLTQIESQLSDQTAKYNETKLEMASQDRIQQSESNIEKTRTHIEESKRDEGLFALKIIASIFFPPLGLYEGLKAADRAVTGQDDGVSMFSHPQAQAQAAANIRAVGTANFWENLGNRIGENLGIIEPKQAEESHKTNESGELDFATEGPELAEQGLSQAEFMKLLQNAQAQEEAKEKLEEAIAALQSGDPKLAADILNDNSESISIVDENGDDLIPFIVEHFATDPTPENTREAYTELTEDLSAVSEDTQQSLEEAENLSAAVANKTSV